jgi:hypothetical protein
MGVLRVLLLDETARSPFIVQDNYLHGNLLRDSEREGGQVVAKKKETKTK